MGATEPEAPRGAGPHDFSKKWRLLKRPEYLRVQNRGVRVHSRNFVILLHPNNLPHPRIGITVSKKVGNSVVRNRVRRRVREVFRQNKLWFPAGRDIVIIAKRRAADITYSEVLEDLRGSRDRMHEVAAGQRRAAPSGSASSSSQR